MANTVLRKEVMERIKKDPTLFGKVMTQLDTTASYGLRLLKENDPRLTQIDVLQIIADHLDKQITDLYEPESASA